MEPKSLKIFFVIQKIFNLLFLQLIGKYNKNKKKTNNNNNDEVIFINKVIN